MDSSSGTDQPLRFGSFELHVRSRELRNGATCVRLQEQPFEILRMMLERPGDVVTRDELQQRLWPDGTFVDFEHSLNAAVKRLRAALGDDADNPRFVETLPRRGYRFIAGVIGGKDTQTAAPLPGPPVRLAVLPFANLTEEGGQRYFADGLTEEMIAQLGRLCRGRIGVISRYSSMTFRDSGRRARDIGEALRADYLLEGSVRGEGDRVRITARLVETRGETHLWVETYEPNLTDYLSVQKDVAARIARSLTMELMPDELGIARAFPKTAAAYQAYLKGRYCWNMLADSGADQALQHFEQATALDPTFAAAHAGVARVHILNAEYYRVPPRRSLEAARQAVKQALDLDPGLFEAHLALGEVRALLEWDWRGAEAAYSRAIELNPSCESAHRAYGLLLAALSRWPDAIREADRACEMDPLCVVVNSRGAAWVRYLAGDYEGAMARSREAVEMEPGYLAARRILGASCLRAGQAGEAIAVLESALARSADDPVSMAWLAHATAVAGRRAESDAMMQRLSRLTATRHLPAYHLALAHAGRGDAAAALAALEQATVDGDPALANLAVEPRFEPIRADIRFARLTELLGL
jgi:TolB-like protein/Tfp pilus assembly protein PilF